MRSIYGNTNSLIAVGEKKKKIEHRACQPAKHEGGLKHHKINKWVVPGSEIGDNPTARDAEDCGAVILFLQYSGPGKQKGTEARETNIFFFH